MSSCVNILVEDQFGQKKSIETPTDISMSLMEFLKANEYQIMATCGGMALCATCHVQVLNGFESLSEPTNDEYAMLDTLPKLTQTSRLACQIQLPSIQDGMEFKLLGEIEG